jgi:hypothetical protein
MSSYVVVATHAPTCVVSFWFASIELSLEIKFERLIILYTIHGRSFCKIK